MRSGGNPDAGIAHREAQDVSVWPFVVDRLLERDRKHDLAAPP